MGADVIARHDHAVVGDLIHPILVGPNAPGHLPVALHFDDVRKLLELLAELTDVGNTVLIIEHNLEVIKYCDYIIDLGPEGGDDGGRVIARGTPEEVASAPNSYTGQYLKKVLPGA